MKYACHKYCPLYIILKLNLYILNLLKTNNCVIEYRTRCIFDVKTPDAEKSARMNNI